MRLVALAEAAAPGMLALTVATVELAARRARRLAQVRRTIPVLALQTPVVQEVRVVTAEMAHRVVRVESAAILLQTR